MLLDLGRTDMSVISSGKKIELAPWLRHFEEQAKGGASAHALTNRHYIIVTQQQFHQQQGGESLEASDAFIHL